MTVDRFTMHPHELVKPGDVVFIDGNGLYSRLIRLAQWRKLRCRYPWTHCGIVMSTANDRPSAIIEAVGTGIRHRPFSPFWERHPFLTYHVEMSDEDRGEVVAFALACSGERYGFVTVASIILNLLTPRLRFTFGLDGTEICSGLVARALERAGFIWPFNPANAMPADVYLGIAEHNMKVAV